MKPRLVWSRPVPNLAPVHRMIALKRALGYPSAIAGLSDNIDLLGERMAALFPHLTRGIDKPPDDAA